MIKVIKNGLVITMNENKEIKNMDVVIKDDKIFDLCDSYTEEYDEIIDANGKVVMPGLINCHTHMGMSIFRGTNDNLNLNDWLNKKIWPIEAKMTDEDVYYATLLTILEMIKTGTTCSNDMYFGCEGGLKALKETKFRCMYSRTLMDIGGKGDEFINEFIKLYNENKDSDLLKFAVTPHAMYTCSKDYLKKCSDLALSLNIPIHMHFCENKNEVNGIINSYNMDPVLALKECGLDRNKLILAHSTFISDKGLNEFKNINVSFIHNPISNLDLGCGVADISKYKKYINVSLGTDGQGSGNNMNLFYHMSLVDLLQKGKYEDPTIFSSYDVLEMATVNGAKALGINDIGSIEVGKKADIIILDLNKPLTYPGVDLITNIVHNVTDSNIDSTIINGEVLYQNKKLLLNINEDELKSKINSIIKKLGM